MNINYRHVARQSIDKILNSVGYELTRRDKKHENYIDLRRTITNAKAAGLSVGDYIDSAFNVPGATQLTIDKIAECGVFRERVENVLEIGPGSGRYLQKTIEACHPARYEIYETSKDWREWLGQTYPVIVQETDGATLSSTASYTINLIHAHKVFPGLKVLTLISYFQEMIRVCAPGGYIVFDMLTENCFRTELLSHWLEESPYWPCAMLPEDFIVQFFEERHSQLVGRFIVPMKPGVTDYFVFKYQGIE